jgi:hypothetical protein
VVAVLGAGVSLNRGARGTKTCHLQAKPPGSRIAFRPCRNRRWRIALARGPGFTNEYCLMSKQSLVYLVCIVVSLSACKKTEKVPPAPKDQAQTTQNQSESASEFDACALITNQEVEAIEGSPVKDVKNSGRSDAGLRSTQCFYTTAEFSRSVSLAVTQPDPKAAPRRNIKEFWEQTFGKNDAGKKETEADKEKRESLRERRGEEERAVPPRKIEGVGEEAFWSPTRVGGALYVLKKDAFVRVSVGGPDPEEKKIEKCKALAQKALDRL